MAYGVSETRRILRWVWNRPAGDGYIVRPVPFLWGHRGQGKTQVNASLPDRSRDEIYVGFNVATIESPGDLWGLPDKAKDKKGNPITVYARPSWLPDDPDSRGVLHIDEPNRANRLVRQALTDILLSYKMGPHPIPKGWLIVCSANPSSESQYDVDELDAALMDRFIHLPFAPKPEEVKTWLARRLPQALISALDGNDTFLGIDDVSLPEIGPSPRSWELFSLIYSPKIPDQVLEACAHGVFGPTVGSQVVALLKSKDQKLVTALDVMLHYTRVRPYVKVWGSLRFSDPGRLTNLIEGVVRWTRKKGGVGSLSVTERKNLQRLYADLSPELRNVEDFTKLYDQSRGRK